MKQKRVLLHPRFLSKGATTFFLIDESLFQRTFANFSIFLLFTHFISDTIDDEILDMRGAVAVTQGDHFQVF